MITLSFIGPACQPNEYSKNILVVAMTSVAPAATKTRANGMSKSRIHVSDEAPVRILATGGESKKKHWSFEDGLGETVEEGTITKCHESSVKSYQHAVGASIFGVLLGRNIGKEKDDNVPKIIKPFRPLTCFFMVPNTTLRHLCLKRIIFSSSFRRSSTWPDIAHFSALPSR